MIETKRHVTTLDNGITVLSEYAPHFNRAAVAVNVMAGGIHDPEGKEGLAHVLEHLIFRGSDTRSSADIQSAIQDLGGYINGQTFLDRTTYSATIIREDIGKTLDLFADMIARPRIDAADLDLEKKIVEDENCRGCFNCSMNEAFFSAAYPDQILSRPIIGFEDTIRDLTVEDLKEFHRDFYVAANLTVAVCGDIEHDALVDMVERSFAALPKGRPSTWPDFRYTGGDMHMGTRSEDAGVWLGFDFTDMDLDEKRAVDMFANILGGHGQSLLMQELREKRGLVYHVSTETETCARRDVLRVYLQGPSSSIRDICTLTIDTIRQAARNLAEDEVDKARRRYHLGAKMSQDALESRVDDMITDISDLGRVTDPAERYKRYQSMTAADITAAARKLLASSPTIAMSAPIRSAPKLSDLRARLTDEKSTSGFFGLLKRAG